MHRNNITTIRRFGRVAAFLCAILPCLVGQLAAHGGFEHVIGTVVKVQADVLTVKTAKGNVDVRLNAKTEITRGDQKADAADLKAGVRVVVDVPEGSKEKVAHSVKIGVSGAAETHSNAPHK
jgi:hypothetical protein